MNINIYPPYIYIYIYIYIFTHIIYIHTYMDANIRI